MPLLPWIIAALVVIGGGVTAAQANNAVPGGPLYNLDQNMEQFQERLMLWSDNARVRFQEQVSAERLQELGVLQNAQPEDMATIAQDLWSQHITEAVDRIESRIDRLHELQAELTAKLEVATTDQDKEKIQSWLDHLTKLEENRTDQLSKVEDREFPGAAAVVKRIENFSEWQNLPKTERQQLQEQVQERIQNRSQLRNRSGQNEDN